MERVPHSCRSAWQKMSLMANLLWRKLWLQQLHNALSERSLSSKFRTDSSFSPFALFSLLLFHRYAQSAI